MTEIQYKVYTFIVQNLTQYEISKRLQITPQTVHGHVEALVNKGFLKPTGRHGIYTKTRKKISPMA